MKKIIVYILIIISLTSCSHNISQEQHIGYNQDIYELLNLEPGINKLEFNSELKVGIIDTGFDLKHPNLNLISMNQIGNQTKDQHGTTISGIISAKANEINDFSGVIPGLSLYVYDLPSEKLKVENLTLAINELRENDVDVINISLATNMYDEELYNAVLNAINEDIVIVASGGNFGDNDKYYPASFEIPGLISVGALNMSNDVLASSTYNDTIDVWAPGENVYSLGASHNSLDNYVGTSVSTPFVTSLVAKVIGNCNDKNLNPGQIEKLIKKSATSFSTKWQNKEVNVFLINFKKTLNECKNN
ncbi:S8 family peptidase [Oceanobacillus luteolus]|uniref:S8 family serine peptidase n=1 Tax=Oceanobacillus luteolus TaxID=1274358 RepID=A0ABW4HSZ7_9BACI